MIGKLLFENPLRQSLYLTGFRFKEPAREKIRISIRAAGKTLDKTVADIVQELASGTNETAVINERIPSKGNLEFELEFREDNTGLKIIFEWSKHTPCYLRFLMPRKLVYSREDIEVLKSTARQGKT